MPDPAVLVFVRRVANAFQRAGGHDANCFPSLRILAARPGLVRASVRIRSENLNRLGTLHGGAICSLTDTLGSLALASRGLYSTGVSTDINTTFVKAGGTTGDEVHVVGTVVSLGKTLATTRIELRHPVSDALLAYGSHTKFIGKAAGHPENVTFDESGERVIAGKAVEEWGED